MSTSVTINADLAEAITDALFAVGSGEGNIEDEKQKLLAKIEEYTETLITRLRAAEDVCVLYGWTGSATRQSVREKALHELWSKWHDLAGPDACDRKKNPQLTDELIAELARKRDETRAATLKRFFGDGGES